VVSQNTAGAIEEPHGPRKGRCATPLRHGKLVRVPDRCPPRSYPTIAHLLAQNPSSTPLDTATTALLNLYTHARLIEDLFARDCLYHHQHYPASKTPYLIWIYRFREHCSKQPRCIAHTPCASRAPQRRRRSKTHLRRRRARRAGCLGAPTSVSPSITIARLAWRQPYTNKCNFSAQLPQVCPPWRLRARSRQEAVAAREDGEKRHAFHGAGRP
jgi:hypothetical protein